MASALIPPSHITAIVLSGGRGSRMGGADKGLQLFGGQPLSQHTAQRIAPQVGQVLINANRHLDVYQSFGYPVFPDADNQYAGPLSGFAAGLRQCQTPYLLTLPCDSPRFPHDLASRMALGLQGDGYEIVMAAQGGWTQPVFCLMRRELLPSLTAFMATGKRKIDAWTAQHQTVVVNFDEPSDDPQAFANANTLEELAALESCGFPPSRE
ncbi:MAG: molybdenum cofactor guanylyltransferase MobA [Cytophagales bacterium]|nr:molybdenum cofactor guanylyltransferase MobA [Cytophagales bacterium]